MNSHEWEDITRHTDLGPDPYIAVYCPDTDDEQPSSDKQRSVTKNQPIHDTPDWVSITLCIVFVLALIGGILIKVL